MPGLLRGVARTAVIAGTATAVSNRVSRRQARRWGQQDQDQYADEAPADEAPADEVEAQDEPPDDMSNRLAQLKELGELKAQGVLTDEEFQQQKQRILG
jgi:hypothetical protein